MNKDMNDLHIKLSDAVEHSKWRRVMRGNSGNRSSDTVMPRAEYELCVSGASSLTLSWI